MYMGGKSRIASKIREHLISHGATRYVEPFVGGGAVLTAVAGDFAEITANDAHEDLIDLYRALQAGWVPPEVVTEEEFNALRSADPSPLRTFAGFCCSYGGPGGPGTPGTSAATTTPVKAGTAWSGPASGARSATTSGSPRPRCSTSTSRPTSPAR